MKMKTGCAFMHDRLNEYGVALLNVDALPIVCQQHVLCFKRATCCIPKWIGVSCSK